MKTSFVCALAVLLASTAACAADSKPDSPADAAAAFGRLKTLVGTWEMNTQNAKIRITYELIAGGTALVEHDLIGGKEAMLTVYHMDGDRLMLTHYCMAGNQPRMQLRSFDAATGDLVFQFLDATNLTNPNAGHMHNATFHILDADHYDSEWQFYVGGKPQTTESFKYTRAK